MRRIALALAVVAIVASLFVVTRGKNCHYNAHFAKRVVCTNRIAEFRLSDRRDPIRRLGQLSFTLKASSVCHFSGSGSSSGFVR
jgi:hypothetical protein